MKWLLINQIKPAKRENSTRVFQIQCLWTNKKVYSILYFSAPLDWQIIYYCLIFTIFRICLMITRGRLYPGLPATRKSILRACHGYQKPQKIQKCNILVCLFVFPMYLSWLDSNIVLSVKWADNFYISQSTLLSCSQSSSSAIFFLNIRTIDTSINLCSLAVRRAIFNERLIEKRKTLILLNTWSFCYIIGDMC